MFEKMEDHIMKALFLVVCLLFVGCSTINFTPASSTAFPPYTGGVEILDRLPEKFQDVGWVTAEAMPQISPGDLLMMTKAQAASKGANAIIYTDESLKIYGPAGRRSLFCRAIIQER